MLYGLLLNRASLSRANGEKWLNPDGHPFVIFTLAEIQEKLNCAKPKAINLLRTLEAHDLIKKDRPKKDGPYHIVVKPFGLGERKSSLGRSENLSSAGKKMLPEQVRKSALNKTDKNNTDRNKTERITLLEEEIKTRIQYDYLISECPKNQVDTVVDVMVQTLMSPAGTITVAGVPMDAATVKGYLNKAEVMRIQYIFDHMEEYNQPIRSYRAYYLARLCDPEGAVDAFYDARAS